MNLTRTSTLLLLAFVPACTRALPPAAPAPEPPPSSGAPVPPPLPSVSVTDPSEPFCVVRNGRLELIEVQVSFKGDTVWRGTPIAQAFRADSTYAGKARWYLENAPISVAG